MRSHAMALEWALALAARRLRVYPAADSKAPICPNGINAATCDSFEVQQLWKDYPGTLVGVRTGAASGLDVLDVDFRNGGDIWLARQPDLLSQTRVHETRSGGIHLLFRHAGGLRCSQGRVANGVDVRADGGGVIWWPATGLPVQCTLPPAEWPAWLLALALPPTHPAQPAPMPPRHVSAYGRGALASAARRVAGAREGRRNCVLNAEAFSLARLIREGTLDERYVSEALTAAAVQAGLTPAEIARTLRSALQAGGRNV
jgi:hypothetical protein